MKKYNNKHGFTLLEVTLFLALSGILMIGLVVGANVSISRQRYNDSVNSFVGFISNTYNDVLNVSSDISVTGTDGPGRTTKAVYGKLITFGELEGSASNPNALVKEIYSYDVVGDAVSSTKITSSSTISMLKDEVNASIYKDDKSFYRKKTFNIPWDAYLQKPNNINGTINSNQFTGALLVVRSPATGTVRTYVYVGTVEALHNNTGSLSSLRTRFTNLLTSLTEEQLDICIDSDDNSNANRNNIRILRRANNSSGVIVANTGEEYNSSSNPNGSRCMGNN